MVRLKESVEIVVYKRLKLFQFLMVRLKVLRDVKWTGAFNNFNSLWCD